MTDTARQAPDVTWREGATERKAVWRSGLVAPPVRVGVADDGTTADAALRRVRRGEVLLYRGDYHNARQLLAAMGRRVERGSRRTRDVAEAFRAERRLKLEEHEILSRLVVPVEGDFRVPLGRAPDVSGACREALGECDGRPGLLPLRELLGIIAAHEWRKKGIWVPALQERIHPHYGVFAPIRAEYVGLVAGALAAIDLSGRRAFDVGTGTGVLAILLARRGASVVATDVDPRAVACARENVARLGVASRVDVQQRDLFPPGTADLVVANPPWIPGRAATSLERAVYDPESRFLSRFLAGVGEHLAPGGEAWLVLSDFAERVGLRAPTFLPEAIERGGLTVVGTGRARPTHPRAADRADPLHEVRSRETTVLHRLAARRKGSASLATRTGLL